MRLGWCARTWMHKVLPAMAVGTLVAVATGCGGGSSDGEGGDREDVSGAADAGSASCTSSTPLKSVALSDTEDGLEVEFAGNGQVHGDLLYSIQVASSDGSVSRQLGVKYVGGALSSYFWFDSASAKQHNLDSSTLRTQGATLTATFPAEALESLGNRWKWYAVLSVNGEDVGLCPGSGDETPLWFPEGQ